MDICERARSARRLWMDTVRPQIARRAGAQISEGHRPLVVAPDHTSGGLPEPLGPDGVKYEQTGRCEKFQRARPQLDCSDVASPACFSMVWISMAAAAGV